MLLHELDCCVFDALVGEDLMSIYSLTGYRASVDSVFVKIAVFVLSVLLSFFITHVKMLDDSRALVCLSALDEHWICHQVACHRTD